MANPLRLLTVHYVAAALVVASTVVVFFTPWNWSVAPGLGWGPTCANDDIIKGSFFIFSSMAILGSFTIFMLVGSACTSFHRFEVLTQVIAQTSILTIAATAYSMKCTNIAIASKLYAPLGYLNNFALALLEHIILVRIAALCSTIGWDRAYSNMRHLLRFMLIMCVAHSAFAISGYRGGRRYLIDTVFVYTKMVTHALYCCMAFAIFYWPMRSLRAVSRTEWGEERAEELMQLVQTARFLCTAVGTSFSFTTLGFGLDVLLRGLHIQGTHSARAIVDLCFGFEAASTIISAILVSGACHKETPSELLARDAEVARRERHSNEAVAYSTCEDKRWQDVVEDLANRAFTLDSLMVFYRGLPDVMPHYAPDVHRTADVVREAIIPGSADLGCAYAVKMMNGVPTRAGTMVTHNWSNLFRDLVAAIVADALEEPDYKVVASFLDSGFDTLDALLTSEARMRTYWVCAFSVNQHQAICAGNPDGSRDPVTGTLHPMCACEQQKYFNLTPPLRDDGKGIFCQMNKFDEMMSYLSATDENFVQVIAVDRTFQLFGRAWCIAEVAAANKMGMTQRLKMFSKASLTDSRESLSGLKIQNMHAARPEDVQEILSKIPDVERFNEDLQQLLFGESGLFAMWQGLDAMQRAEKIGRVVRVGTYLARGPMHVSLRDAVKARMSATQHKIMRPAVYGCGVDGPVVALPSEEAEPITETLQEMGRKMQRQLQT